MYSNIKVMVLCVHEKDVSEIENQETLKFSQETSRTTTRHKRMYKEHVAIHVRLREGVELWASAHELYVSVSFDETMNFGKIPRSQRNALC
jgi:hypothetical protein